MEEHVPWLSAEVEGAQFGLKLDLQKLFGSLFDIAKNVAVKPLDVADNAATVFKTLKLQDKPAARAGFLLQRALTRALQQIIEDNRFRFPKELPDERSVMQFYGRTAVQRTTNYLNKDFFQKPLQLPLIAEVSKALITWLGYFQVPQEEAQRIAEAQLPRLFLYSLNGEWRENAEFYKPILNAMDTPFQPADERAYDWTRYRLHLTSEFSAAPMFDEKFSLAKVYVPLRAYWERADGDSQTAYHRGEAKTRVVVELQASIEEWLQRRDANDALRVISGGPGSGKSSFGKALAARLAEGGRYVLFIPLFHFDAKADIVAAVGKYLADYRFFAQNPLDPKTEDTPIVLIFDGLDEIASQGRASKELAENFVRALKEFLHQRNSGGLRVHALLSGREIVIQTHAGDFRGEGQILHVLPYYLPQEEIQPSDYTPRTYTYTDEQGLLAEDQRQKWWENFQEVKDGERKSMPEKLQQRGELDEITAQPLLNYLVALSFRRKPTMGDNRQPIDFATEDNLNAIYADLLHSVYMRKWGDKNNPHAHDLSEQDFSDVLEEIGLAVWQGGNGRTATLEAIQAQCGGAGSPLLTKFAEGAEKGVLRLFTAFYIRRNDVFAEPTFEFTHKSFGEYLAARRVTRAVCDLHEELNAERRRARSVNPEAEALVEWARICGPTPLDHALLGFARREIALLSRNRNAPKVAALQQTLARLIGVMLRVGMPMHDSRLSIKDAAGFKTFGEMNRQARNAEEALLAVLNACARVTEEPSTIEWSAKDEQGGWQEPAAAAAWLRRLCGTRTDFAYWWNYTPARNPLTLDCLTFLNLSGCLLLAIDFAGANLTNANLVDVDLTSANLTYANLTNASLMGASLANANLTNANLTNANLTNASLMGASLMGADLMGADLTNANLTNAGLTYARLTDAHNWDWALHWKNSRNLDEAILNAEQRTVLLAAWEKARK